jgi:GNAT superfamily N-acetyltransferase
MAEVVIRPMRADDVDRVANLLTQLGYPATGPEIARRFERIGGERNQALLIADEAGTAIAWMHVAVHPYLESDTTAEIVGLVVADGHRSRGIGKALVDAAESWAAAQGCRMLRVRSRIVRERAHAFYERAGFQRIKTQHCFEKRIGAEDRHISR